MKHTLPLKNFLHKSGAMSLCRRFIDRQTVSILRYHSVSEPEDNFYASPSVSLRPAVFESQIRFLSDNFQIISLDTVADCIANQRLFPEKAVVLTFDDGYRDNYAAYQMMKSCRVAGTFYVVAGCIDGQEPLWLFEVFYLLKKTRQTDMVISVKGAPYHFSLVSDDDRLSAARSITAIVKSNNRMIREDIRKQLRAKIQDVPDIDDKAAQVMLTWEQVQEMSRNGMTVGGHTMTHLNLPNADYPDAVAEIQGSRRLIEENIGAPVRHFSYPNGGNYAYYNDAIIKIVRESGYITSTTSHNGTADLNSPLLELKRIRVTPHLSEILYQMTCEPTINKIRGKRYAGAI